MDQHFSDATDILAAISSGVSSAQEAARACLDRIAEREDDVGAWAHIDPVSTLKQARQLDAAAWRGSLHGLPVGIKDVLLTRDMPTQYGCDFYAGHAPALDATAVALLRQAGAIILGKTTTVELASIGAPPRTRNPRNLDHTPGGSSSGSAAAVADGHVPIALGTQTGGSIIRPASFCGVWALKPTWGTVSTEGAKSFAPSLDTIGWFTRSARDLTLMLDLFDPTDAMPSPPPTQPRIAIWRTAGWPRAEAATQSAMTRAIATMKASGFTVEELELPAPFADLAEAHRTIMLSEGGQSFLTEYRIAPDKLHPRIRDMVSARKSVSQQQLRAAHDLAAQARATFDRIAADYDAVLTPSTIGEAPQGLSSTGDLLFNGLLTLLHVPCVNMPFWAADNGLPVGLTLTGSRYADRQIIALAATIESMT